MTPIEIAADELLTELNLNSAAGLITIEALVLMNRLTQLINDKKREIQDANT